MTRYKYIIYLPSGEKFDSYDEEGAWYETEEDAQYAVNEWIGAYRYGGEILHLSNPGDYDEPGDCSDIEYDIVEMEDNE